MIKAQGGKIDKLPAAKYSTRVLAKKNGYLRGFDTCAIGLTASLLGAGRQTKEDRIDPSAGIRLNKKLGDRVVPGEVLAEFHYNRNLPLKAIEQKFLTAITIGRKRPTVRPLILERW
jgi:thymidine phosphorylase